MNRRDRHSARRLGAFMYRLTEFVQENPGLTAGASRPIRFLPQLIPHFRKSGPLQEIREAVFLAKPYEGSVNLFHVRITWDEASRTLTFSAPPEAAVAVTPKVIDLSESRLDELETGAPKAAAAQ